MSSRRITTHPVTFAVVALMVIAAGAILYQATLDPADGLSDDIRTTSTDVAATLPSWVSADLGEPAVKSSLPPWASIPETANGNMALESPLINGTLKYRLAQAGPDVGITYENGSVFPGAADFTIVMFVENNTLESLTIVPERLGATTWEVPLDVPKGTTPEVDAGAIHFGSGISFAAPSVRDEAGNDVTPKKGPDGGPWGWKLAQKDGAWVASISFDDAAFPEPYVIG